MNYDPTNINDVAKFLNGVNKAVYGVEPFKVKEEMTVCDYGANPSLKAFNCIREEQCDDCFMVDHKKECNGCEHYDHA